MTPSEYVDTRCTEGTADGTILERLLSHLARDIAAWQVQDDALAEAEDRAQKELDRLRTKRLQALDKVQALDWYRRAAIAHLCATGAVFPPDRKSAELPSGTLRQKHEKELLQIHDKAALKALTPQAERTGTAWHEPTAKALLCNVDGHLIAAGDLLRPGEDASALAWDDEHACCIYKPSGEVLDRPEIPLSVASIHPERHYLVAEVGPLALELPDRTAAPPPDEDPFDEGYSTDNDD